MGLDNGIFVKSNCREITRDILPDSLVYPFDKDYGNQVDIAYWRKCWGLRNEILNILNTRFIEDNYYSEIDTPEKIQGVMDVIFSFMNKQVWEDDGNSIWDYETIIHNLRDCYMNLVIMKNFMHENPDVYLVFYDSY